MNNPSTLGMPRQGVVKLIHNRVAGRIRLEVKGLYRSPKLKRRLEKALLQVHGVRVAEANIRTGRLLVVYETAVEPGEIIGHVENQFPGARQVTAPVFFEPEFRGFKSSNVLDGIKATLRGVTSSFIPVSMPALGMTAGVPAMAVSGADKEQELHPWHTMNLESLVSSLEASENKGLTVDEAGIRLRRYGPNSLTAAEKRSDLAIFIDQFINAPVGLLAASAVISVATGGAVDAAVIMGVVLINSIIGFITEQQAEKTISSLTQSGVKAVTVLRDGESTEFPVEMIVPGDVLLLVPGTYIAADIRLLRSHRLSVDESALTGESMPVAKDHEYTGKEDTALGDRVNMGYMGTHVTGGSGRGVVIATAKATELGQIQTMVGEAEAPETPMQKQLTKLGTQMVYISSGVCVVVMGIGVLRGFGWLEMLKSAVSLAVAAVPEGLPAVATTTLAMGIGEMRKKDVAVRHLDAVETLGSVQVFCMDKTGTLTMNRMAVISVHSGSDQYDISEQKFQCKEDVIDPLDKDGLVRLMRVVSLCSEVKIIGASERRELEGSPTENALVEMALDAGVDVVALRSEHPIIRTRYRAEGRPYMSTLHPYKKGKHLLAVKGSPAEVLTMCNHQVVAGEIVPLTKEARSQIIAMNDRMAGRALRVLGAAYRELDEAKIPSRTGQLIWLGLAGMADPMRPGMDQLIAKYHQAGIGTIMITGDQAATAQAIGEQLGLSGSKPLQVLESSKLDDMDPELLAGLAKNVHVFARVSPAHKLKIVRALQEAGYVVAMTGDGINDGPALKASDIGVAMGASGTNVAREVSDVVLEDDNLHTMATAVSQGRTIYSNIRKMIHFMVSTNLTEIEVMLIGIAAGWGQPMNPMQLLWINLVTDIFPGLALSMEPAEDDVMDRDPRDPEEAIIGGQSLKRMVFESGTIGLGVMGAYYLGMKRYGIGAEATTLAFNTLTLNELVHAMSSRSHYRNVIGGQKLRPNHALTAAVLGMGALQVVVSVVPGARLLLGTTALEKFDLLAIAAGVLGPLIVNEFTKPTAPRQEQSGKVIDSDVSMIQKQKIEQERVA
ncbi:MAG: cation-transporting P-type ATPase [Gammaproteobacteria bacterium]|nr:cation-transporting P-type ATPase [Gammaproteobacteria bacterium]